MSPSAVQFLDRVTHRLAGLCETVAPVSLSMPLLAWSGWLWGEPEMRLLRYLVPKDKIAVDVGGAEGGYAYFLSRLARQCHVFEANPESAAAIQRRLPAAHVHALALSSRAGEIELRIPVVRGVAYTGWASVEPRNSFAALPEHHVRTQLMPVATLDSFRLRDVGFIKIDVEGHEIDVLRGAEGTLRTDHPTLLVEAEDRHRPGSPQEICRFLKLLGYRTACLDQGKLRLLDDDRNGGSKLIPPPHIRNFIFLAADRLQPSDQLASLFR